MVRHAPIHRRLGHSDIAICCGRNVRGSSPSTLVVPLSNQVTTLNHKRFKGFKMFSDGHLENGINWTTHYFEPRLNRDCVSRAFSPKEDALRQECDLMQRKCVMRFVKGPNDEKMALSPLSNGVSVIEHH